MIYSLFDELEDSVWNMSANRFLSSEPIFKCFKKRLLKYETFLSINKTKKINSNLDVSKFFSKKINTYIRIVTVFPCTEMHALKPKLLGNRCSIKHVISHILIRIQVGYTVQYIHKLNSYLNLNKYMTKKRVLWCIYFQVLEIWCIAFQYKGLR